MKTLLTLLIFSTLGCQSTIAAISVSWPVNYSVFQRSSSNNAIVVVAGQYFVGNTLVSRNAEWRVLQLSPQNGSYQSTVFDWQSFYTQNDGLFRLPVTLNGGWYQLEVRGNSNGTQESASLRFGVGDVYLIAGQSNAQGVTDGILYNESAYNGVVADNHGSDVCSKQIPLYPNLGPIPSYSSSNNQIFIAPQGQTPWCYTALGNDLVNLLGVPVAFFNGAQGGTTIENWEQSSQGNATSYWFNNSRQVCNPTGDPSQNAPYYGHPYIAFKNVLNYYGSMFGARAVLWHQGEADNNVSRNEGDYQYRLSLLISKARTDFGDPNLAWFVARATYNEAVSNPQDRTLRPIYPNWGPVRNAQQNIVSGSVKLGPDTDPNITPTTPENQRTGYRNPDINKVHFQGGQLKALADSWAASINASIGSTQPVIANTIPYISVSGNGSGPYTLTASGNYQAYYWVQSGQRLNPANPTGQSISIYPDPNISYQCYAKVNVGTGNASNYVVSQVVTVPGNSPYLRVGAEEILDDNPRGIRFSVYPNPTNERADISFTLPNPAQNVQLEILDEKGKVVKTLANNSHAAGSFKYPVNVSQLPTGLYLCRLKVDDLFITKKLLKGAN